MTLEDKKAFILSIVKNKGMCYSGSYASIDCTHICVLTGKAGCCYYDDDSYKLAVAWAAENCKEDLLEQLI